MRKISDAINNLPAIEKAELDNLICVKSYKKGELIFKTSTVDSTIFYISKGLLRKFVIKNLKEKTLDFYFPDEICFPLDNIEMKTTGCFLQAMTDTVLFSIPNNAFEKTKASSIVLLKLENFILESSNALLSERLQQFQTMNATERYMKLIEKNSHIIQNIPLGYIASYLGINNASLSKIRASLH